MKPANKVLSGYGVTVFETMSRLAIEHNAINLGQGFPDEDGPEELRQIAAEAAIKGPNQYPPMLGIPELRKAVANHNKRFYDLDVNWEEEILITSGATEALAACIFCSYSCSSLISSSIFSVKRLRICGLISSTTVGFWKNLTLGYSLEKPCITVRAMIMTSTTLTLAE